MSRRLADVGHPWRVAWLVPVLIVLHNLEEGLTLRPWLAQEGPRLAAFARHVGLSIALDPDRVSARYTAALVITAAVPLAIVAAAQLSRARAGLYAILVIQAVMFANVFSHVLAAAWSGGYAPGLVTAVLLNAPFSLYLFRAAQAEGAVEPRTLRRLVVLGALALLPLVALALLAGGLAA